MDKAHYDEMVKNLECLVQKHELLTKRIYLFGHCNATEELADLLLKKGLEVKCILDNNKSKHGILYRGIPVAEPGEIMAEDKKNALVCIAARASAAMEKQLRQMGYRGMIEKLVVYNSYAEYSFSYDTILRRRKRVKRGISLLDLEKEKYPGAYRIYCPFSGLGDIYYMMSYLPHFLKKKSIGNYVVFTIGNACRDVAEMFGAEHTEVLGQTEMDELIQATLYLEDTGAYIPHQDRPYVVNLAKALHMRKIPLEMLYKYGVFGLKEKCAPYKPCRLKKFDPPQEMIPGKSVIISPYAKSVTSIPEDYWNRIVCYFSDRGYCVFTNVSGDEKPLPGTIGLTADLNRMKSAVEQAGAFIGLRSGLCDVVKDADCKKVALYPDCYYSDTKWKMEEIYHLDGWENIVIR